MTTLVALLRAVNVGKRQLAMPTLMSVCEDRGFASPVTYLRSGNVVFGSDDPPAEVTATLEAALREACGFDVACVIRTLEQLEAIVATNPFPEAAADRPSKLGVMFLASRPARQDPEATGEVPGPEEVELIGSELYVDYVEGMGRSKLTTSMIETAVGAPLPPGTTRNWNTVTKLAALARAHTG